MFPFSNNDRTSGCLIFKKGGLSKTKPKQTPPKSSLIKTSVSETDYPGLVLLTKTFLSILLCLTRNSRYICFHRNILLISARSSFISFKITTLLSSIVSSKKHS